MAAASSLINGALLAASMALPQAAAASETACPATQQAAKLKTVTVFDGPPQEMASLMHDRSRESKKGNWAQWNVAYIFKAGRRLYVRCGYGPDIAAVIIKPPVSVTRCEGVFSRPDASASFSCR